MTSTETERNDEIVYRDPRDLRSTDLNLRGPLPDVSGLKESIAANGILVPLIIDEGDIVLAGSRRLIAAVQLDLPRVPCIVRGDLADTPDVIRTILAENVARRDLTVTEEANGYSQLALLGIPVATMAHHGGRTPDKVEGLLALADAPKAAAIVAEHDLTITQAIALAEFEGERTALRDLTVTAQRSPQHFDHEVELQRARLNTRREIETKKAALEEAGVTLLKARPRYGEKAVRPISQLDNGKGRPLTEAGHRKCPGHAAFVERSWDDVNGGTKISADFYCTTPDVHTLLKGSPSARYVDDKPEATPEQAEREADLARIREEFAAATIVRRNFLQRMCMGRGIPTTVAPMIWRELVTRDLLEQSIVTYEDETEDLLAFILDIKKPEDGWEETLAIKVVTEASDKRLATVVFAQLAALTEESIDPTTWRGPFFDGDAARMFDIYKSLGYTPAKVETELLVEWANKLMGSKKVSVIDTPDVSTVNVASGEEDGPDE